MKLKTIVEQIMKEASFEDATKNIDFKNSKYAESVDNRLSTIHFVVSRERSKGKSSAEIKQSLKTAGFNNLADAIYKFLRVAYFEKYKFSGLSQDYGHEWKRLVEETKKRGESYPKHEVKVTESGGSWMQFNFNYNTSALGKIPQENLNTPSNRYLTPYKKGANIDKPEDHFISANYVVSKIPDLIDMVHKYTNQSKSVVIFKYMYESVQKWAEESDKMKFYWFERETERELTNVINQWCARNEIGLSTRFYSSGVDSKDTSFGDNLSKDLANLYCDGIIKGEIKKDVSYFKNLTPQKFWGDLSMVGGISE